MMSDGELLRRREELYLGQPSSIEADRHALYMELGLIEQLIHDVCAPIRPLPSRVLEATYFSSFKLFQWVQPPTF